MKTVTVTRTAPDRFAVVTDVVLADGTYRADYALVLQGNTLRSAIEPGTIRIGGLMSLRLGPVSLPRVQALAVGDSVRLQ